ncbi:MAG: hypothetical protein ACTSU8_05770 [Alphaproteobacteria bacterium]
MSFHVTDTFGISTPLNACITESRRSTRISRNIVRCEDGEIGRLRGGKVREIDVTNSGKGDPAFSAVTIGAFAEGVIKLISAEGTEVNNGEYSDMELVGKGWEDGVSPGGAGDGLGAAGFQFTDFGIKAMATAKTTNFRLKKSVEVGSVVLDEGGLFSSNVTYGEMWEFSAEGSGDLPADGTIGGSGPTIGYVTGGISLIDSTDENQSVGEEQAWEFSGVNAAGAV